jgi:hypothetical protein
MKWQKKYCANFCGKLDLAKYRMLLEVLDAEFAFGMIKQLNRMGRVMKISEKRHTELYRAITNPIIDLRVRLHMGDAKDFDLELKCLEHKIYAKIKDALYLSKS